MFGESKGVLVFLSLFTELKFVQFSKFPHTDTTLARTATALLPSLGPARCRLSARLGAVEKQRFANYVITSFSQEYERT